MHRSTSALIKASGGCISAFAAALTSGQLRLNRKHLHMADDFIPIPRLSLAIRQMTGKDGPGYRKLHMLACDGKIPAQQVGRFWSVKRSDLPAVIAALGLLPRPIPLHVSRSSRIAPIVAVAGRGKA
jgi:hypothetical protein